ncbi:MAG: DUF5674 family protein [Nitrospinota bacterium]
MGGKFVNRMVPEPATEDQLKELAAGHRGVVKAVVDVKRRRMAAGAEWHTECLELLKENGSNSEDCWGLKLVVETGEIKYKSQINKNRPGNRLDEIEDPKIRETVAEMVRERLVKTVEG